MKERVLILFTSFTCLFALGQDRETVAALTAAQWQEDVDYFKEQLIKRHKNAFHTVSKEEFEADVNRLRSEVGSLKDYQIIVRLLQMTAKVGDGHTAVHLPTWFKRYPLVLNWYDNDLYVIAGREENREAIGTRVVKIGGLPMEEVNKRLATVLSQAENKWCDMNTGAYFLSSPEILVTLGIVADYDNAPFTFLNSDNKEINLNVVPEAVSTAPMRTASKSTPLFRQKLGDPFWFTYLDDIQAVYVNFKKYDDLSKNANALFDFIEEKKATRLIVDLRFNGGGDFLKGRRLLISRIKENTTLNQKGNLFVISGRRTFSAAMVNTIDFKKETNAIILGEPPGERPNSYSENDEMKLPNSDLVVSYSTRYYKFLDEDVPAFEPDIRIDPTFADFKEGRDAVMEWIVSYCKK